MATKTEQQALSWDSARRQVGRGLVSVIMPAFNLGGVISSNIRHVRGIFLGQVPFEIVVVDDGSGDGTRQEIEKTAAQVPELRPVFLARNGGKGAAVIRGFEASRGTHILFLDADLDLPPAQACVLFDVMERNRADVVIGSKQHPESSIGTYPWHRRIVSVIYYGLIKTLIGLPVRDTQTGMKLFKREVLDWTAPRMLVKQFAFDLEMLAIAHEKGFRISEAPIKLNSQGRWGRVGGSVVKQVMHDTLAVFYRLRLLRYYQSIRDTRMPDLPPMVSIIIACPAPSAYLEECLNGISRQTWGKYEIIILPDAPTGRQWTEKAREIPTGRCRPAEKRNIGVRHARGEIVAFIDDDVIPLEDWIMRAVVYFGDPDIAAVGGPAATAGGDSFMAELGGDVYANRLVSGQFRYRYIPGRVLEVEDFPSCNLLVRTEVMKQLGGFRTDFWPGEDTYLCLDITKKLGRKIIYDPRVHVLHHRRALFLPHLRQIARYALHRGYFARHFPETSRKVSYAMPSFFVMGLFFGGILSFACPMCRLVYLVVLAMYGAITFVSCARRNVAAWFLTWLGVVSTHVCYGVFFLVGLFTRNLPGEVRRFDHPSEGGQEVPPRTQPNAGGQEVK